MKRALAAICAATMMLVAIPSTASAYTAYTGFFAKGLWQHSVGSNNCTVLTNTYWSHNWDYTQAEGFKITGVRGTWTTSSQTLKTITLSAHEYGVIGGAAQKTWDGAYGPVGAPAASVSGGVKTYTLYHALAGPILATPPTMTEVAWGKASATLATGKVSAGRAGVGNGSGAWSDAPIWRIYGPKASQTAYGKTLGMDAENQFQFNDTTNADGFGTLGPTQVTIAYDAVDYAAGKRAKPGTVVVNMVYMGYDADYATTTGRWWNTAKTVTIPGSSFTKSVSSDGKTTRYTYNINVSSYPRLITASSITGMSWSVSSFASVVDAAGKSSTKDLEARLSMMN
jgi:hypothetical protein